MFKVKGLTAWDNIETGLFKSRQEAEVWLKTELIRTNWDKKWNKQQNLRNLRIM